MGLPLEFVRESLKAVQVSTMPTEDFGLVYWVFNLKGFRLGFVHRCAPDGEWMFYPEDGANGCALNSDQLRDLHSLCQILHCFTEAEEFVRNNNGYR